jgi:hypothetical protein
MNFNKRISQLLNEAGGYMGGSTGIKSVEEAIKKLADNFKTLERNAAVLKTHPENYRLDNESLKVTIEIINILNEFGPRLTTKAGKSLDVRGEIQRALQISNRPEHDYTKITPETKVTSWPLVYRPWFNLYSNHVKFKAVDRRSISQEQVPEPDEIFYFGTDRLPYVTRLSFDAEDKVHGTIFLRTNRFKGIQVDQIKDEEGKPVKPVKFEGKKPKGTIPLNASVERVFGNPEVSREELKQVLNSKAAEVAFKKRMNSDPELKAWYTSKYTRAK